MKFVRLILASTSKTKLLLLWEYYWFYSFPTSVVPVARRNILFLLLTEHVFIENRTIRGVSVNPPEFWCVCGFAVCYITWPERKCTKSFLKKPPKTGVFTQCQQVTKLFL